MSTRSEFVATDQNPTIDNAGQATVSANHFCLWNTNNGSTSNCALTNPGNANTVTFVVSGAPATILTTAGISFNGQHSISPNNPTQNVTAVGDFLGTKVTIFNMSNPDADFHANVVVAT